MSTPEERLRSWLADSEASIWDPPSRGDIREVLDDLAAAHAAIEGGIQHTGYVIAERDEARERVRQLEAALAATPCLGCEDRADAHDEHGCSLCPCTRVAS